MASSSTERARLRAERQQLGATDQAGLTGAWEMVTGQWAATVTRARGLPEPLLHQRVDGEWSFVETQRHLVLASDCWVRRMVKGMPDAYHPWGLGGSWLTAPLRWGLDPDAAPSLDQVLAVRAGRVDEVRDLIAGVDGAELERICVPPETPGHPRREHRVLACLHVVLKEEWQHHRYATRDLTTLEQRHR